MRVLRAGLSEDLGTLLYEIERTMLLDIELAVRPGTDPLGSRANLDAFHEVAAAYATAGMPLRHREDLGDWTTLVVRRG